MLVRTWNLFHGNAHPAERQAFLEQAVRLAVRDRPDVLCLQELPVWALSRLADWTGMTAVGDIAARPILGSSRTALELERKLTELNEGLLRSALTGQANAILVAASLRIVEHRLIVLNPASFRRLEGRRLRLGLIPILEWGKNRRVCQAVRVEREAGTIVVANLHATAKPDKRLADAEVLRAAAFVDGFARPGESVVLAGDFNLTVRNSHVLPELTTAEWDFEGPTRTGIDHVLVRGQHASEPVRWPVERRMVGSRVLSDHAPVEREIA